MTRQRRLVSPVFVTLAVSLTDDPPVRDPAHHLRNHRHRKDRSAPLGVVAACGSSEQHPKCKIRMDIVPRIWVALRPALYHGNKIHSGMNPMLLGSYPQSRVCKSRCSRELRLRSNHSTFRILKSSPIPEIDAHRQSSQPNYKKIMDVISIPRTACRIAETISNELPTR